METLPDSLPQGGGIQIVLTIGAGAIAAILLIALHFLRKKNSSGRR
jgi:hypothetical protein